MAFTQGLYVEEPLGVAVFEHQLLRLAGAANMEHAVGGGVGELDLHQVGDPAQGFQCDVFIQLDVLHDGLFVQGDAYHALGLAVHGHYVRNAVEDAALLGGRFAGNIRPKCSGFEIGFGELGQQVKQVSAQGVVLALKGLVAEGVAQPGFIGVAQTAEQADHGGVLIRAFGQQVAQLSECPGEVVGQ